MFKVSNFYTRGDSSNLNGSPQPLYVYSVCNTELTDGGESFNHSAKNTFAQLQWGLEGIGEIFFFDRRYEMRENDVFIWLPGEEQRLRAVSKSWGCRWLSFDGPLVEAILLSYRFPRHIRSNVPCPVELLEEIARNIGSEDPYMTGHLAGLVLEILAWIRKSPQDGASPLVERCMNYVRNHYQDPDLCIETLCDAFQMPRSTLTRLFQDQAQRALGSYIRDVRYGNALGLLSNTELPIQEIARRCGYASYPSFCRLIRRGTGLSPSAYRRKRTEVR